MIFSKTKICDELNELYGKSISLYTNTEDWKINVIIYHSNVKEIKEKWTNVSSAVSMCYQAGVSDENEFEKWNLYIIYICSDKVNKELKAKIENDKYSSRKIVEISEKEISDDLINEYIIKHITNTDLIEIVDNTKENKHEKYVPINNSIWNLIPRNITISHNKEKQDEIIEELKKLYNEN